MSLASRFLTRVAPINVGDSTLGELVAAITAPGEVMETIASGSASHGPWGKAVDPDEAPASLLRWLKLFPGVTFQPGDTESVQRYRIKQAAGDYQATPRAIIEELQLILSGTKTVYLGFHAPDQWHYLVGVITSEAPSGSAVAAAVERQEPAGMNGFDVYLSGWTWFTLAPDLVAHRETIDGEDSYVVDAPEYPTWQSVVDHFSTWQHLVDNDPDL